MENEDKIPNAIDGSQTRTDKEPKTYAVKDTDIQGVYGLKPGDVDPDFIAPDDDWRPEERKNRAFEPLGKADGPVLTHEGMQKKEH
ncbi:MAG TPA: hypothetical protein VFV50_06410 [Bdellovibrionales bacterium]|nr:hypothetical protein [Bdellovibrionales bacterium]